MHCTATSSLIHPWFHLDLLDACCRIYDLEKLNNIVKEGGRTPQSCEFFEPPSCPFYKYEAGDLSPYGAEELPVLQYIASHGAMDGAGFSQVGASHWAAHSVNGL